MIKPRKSLGQNFLRDLSIANDIVANLEIKNNDEIVEIGPGEGVLTELILRNNCKLTSIEIDSRAVKVLKDKFASNSNFSIIECDFLKFSFDYFFHSKSISSEPDFKLKVIGNIPYYISSEIFFKLFEESGRISRAVLTIQKELALRLIAKPRTKDYGILTLAMQIHGQCRIAKFIPPEAFYPIPKVESAVVIMEFKPLALSYDKKYSMMRLIRQAFNQRRKKLSNALSAYFVENNINPNYLDQLYQNKFGDRFLHKRAEELSFDEFNFIHSCINQSKYPEL